MIKISITNELSVATLRVEGRVAGPWAVALEDSWQNLWASTEAKPLRLDLRGVSFVDAHGARILREIVKRTAAEAFGDSPLTEYFANQTRRDPAPEPIEEN